MPYGHIKQYHDLVNEAQNKRIKITDQQRRQIARLYRDLAKDFGHTAAKKSEKTLTYRWLKDYGKALKSESTALYQQLQGIVKSGIHDTAAAVAGAESQFWGNIVPSLSLRFRDTMSTIPQSCVDELMNGGIYRDFTGLSERIWNYKKKFDIDIGYIINRGIMEQKPALELAKDLELYLQPSAKKPWEWKKVYPNSNAIVDYNAQRLARTSITHAYQMSFQRSTIDNPFIEKYQWHSSNAGKYCELCRQRDGKLFDKDDVPLDHPNGMCVITAVIPKSMNEIASELNEWASGRENKELDKWLKPAHIKNLKSMNISISKEVYRKSGISREVCDCINNAIANLQKEYVIKLGDIDAGPIDDNTIFATTPYIDDKGGFRLGLVINQNLDYDRLTRKIKRYYESGRFAGKTLEDYITHEMAHVMTYQGCETERDYNILKSIVDKLFVEGISLYADRSKNGNESLAEAFVRYRNGEEIPIKARILITSYIERWRK